MSVQVTARAVPIFEYAGIFKINRFYEKPAEYPAIHGGDECGRGDAIPLHALIRCPAF
ncbi:MAG: hypothetical protein KJ687_02385 [Proteobacteria bacterium]|nr:hypothetical protein [Pseudomonadota bacterium]